LGWNEAQREFGIEKKKKGETAGTEKAEAVNLKKKTKFSIRASIRQRKRKTEEKKKKATKTRGQLVGRRRAAAEYVNA